MIFFKSLGKEQVAYPHPQGPRLFCSFAIQDKENVISIKTKNSTLFIAFIFLQSYKKGGFIIKKLSTLCTLIKKFTIYFHLYLYFHDIFVESRSSFLSEQHLIDMSTQISDSLFRHSQQCSLLRRNKLETYQ